MRWLVLALVFVAGPGWAGLPRAEAGRMVAFDVLLPLRDRTGLEALVVAQQTPGSAQFHHWLSPADFAQRFGPDPAALQAAAALLRTRGFSASVHTRSIHAVGAASSVEAAFGTHLVLGRTTDGAERVVEEHALVVPPEIAAVGGRVFSFSPHMAHVHGHVVTRALDPDNRQSATGVYWFDDLKQAYAYPSVQNTIRGADGEKKLLDGTGATIAVLMAGDVYDSDVRAMFEHENWTPVTHKAPPALFQRMAVNGGASTNSPAFAEASLDVQQALAGAPGAHVMLVQIPDLSDGNVIAGYIGIIEANRADVVSSSFGVCERVYSAPWNGGRSEAGILQAEHELFLQGNAQGITFIASSGDNAGKECPAPAYFQGANADFLVGVDSPASDPDVTSVGGTNLVTGAKPGSMSSPYVGENGWADPEYPYDPYGVGSFALGGYWGAGSGYSVFFPRPAFQRGVSTGSAIWRAVPDVGMQVGGCPRNVAEVTPAQKCDDGGLPQNGAGNTQRSSVIVALGVGIGGGFYGMIGTSVAAPEFAGATALLVERAGRQGNLNFYLYRLAAAQAAGNGVYFHTGIGGYNGLRPTDLNPLYSLSVGVGTPVVSQYINAGTVIATGVPQTLSNP